MPAALLEAWSHVADQPGHSRVLPDGCRDLIRIAVPGQRPVFMLSRLDDGCQWVSHGAGTVYHGYRLRPGALIQEQALLAQANQTPDAEHARVMEWLDSFSRNSPLVAEALESLTQGRMPADAGAQRRLERLLKAATGRPPIFWRGLARARRAARRLATTPELAALAAECGFADQSHLSREMRRWFGSSPTELRGDDTLLWLISQSGYG